MEESIEKDCETCEHEHDSSNEYCGSCDEITNNWTEAGWHRDTRNAKEFTELHAEIAKLIEIADLAYDIHTRDPINVKERWGAMGNAAERLLIDKIETLRVCKT